MQRDLSTKDLHKTKQNTCKGSLIFIWTLLRFLDKDNQKQISQPAITCLKLTIEAQGVKYVQS